MNPNSGHPGFPGLKTETWGTPGWYKIKRSETPRRSFRYWCCGEVPGRCARRRWRFSEVNQGALRNASGLGDQAHEPREQRSCREGADAAGSGDGGPREPGGEVHRAPQVRAQSAVIRGCGFAGEQHFGGKRRAMQGDRDAITGEGRDNGSLIADAPEIAAFRMEVAVRNAGDGEGLRPKGLRAVEEPAQMRVLREDVGEKFGPGAMSAQNRAAHDEAEIGDVVLDERQAAVIPSFTGDGISIALHSAALAAAMLLAGETASAYHRALRADLRRAMNLATWLSRAAVTAPGRASAFSAASLFPRLMRLIAQSTRIPQRALIDFRESPAPPGAPPRNLSATPAPE